MSDQISQEDSLAGKAEAFAEKAYATATEAIVSPPVAKPAPQTGPATASPAVKTADAEKPATPAAAKVKAAPKRAKPVKAPAKAGAATPPAPAKLDAAKPEKPETAAKPAKAAVPVKAPSLAEAPVKAKRKPASRKAPVLAKTRVKPVRAAKPQPARRAKPGIAKASRKPVTPASAMLPKNAGALSLSQIKESTMDVSSKIAEGVKSAVADAQDKAKAAYEKGSAAFGTYTEFTKGNLEAIVESGKILATGIKDMGTEFVADSKDTVETFTSDVKQIAAVKSPSELVKLQGEMMRRNFDRAVAYNSKASENMLKLANEVLVPISGRISLAMDKIRKAA
ncbi:MAG: TIGR01841 family phasin [Novosphingobium sp.]|nr:TIGR01841 family phasin [Novosphingobium sp.]